MSPLVMLLTGWGVLTAVLVVLLIYRSTLSMHEDDQMFLNASDAHMEKEQNELRAKMNRISPLIKTLSGISAAMLVIMVGVFLYQGLQRTP